MNETVSQTKGRFQANPSSASSILQRKCACGNHTMASGECAECAKKKSGLQRKLTIGASDDPLEREADRVADQVLKSALDTAFMRRLRFIVNFPFPGIPERKRIWEKAFPQEAAKETLDYERLAKFNLTGGSIQNIAINAAFLAASAGGPVTMPLIFEATRSEFRKLEKPANEAEFRLMQAVEAKA